MLLIKTLGKSLPISFRSLRNHLLIKYTATIGRDLLDQTASNLYTYYGNTLSINMRKSEMCDMCLLALIKIRRKSTLYCFYVTANIIV